MAGQRRSGVRLTQLDECSIMKRFRLRLRREEPTLHVPRSVDPICAFVRSYSARGNATRGARVMSGPGPEGRETSEGAQENRIDTAGFRELGLSPELVEYAAAQRYPAGYRHRVWLTNTVAVLAVAGAMTAHFFAYRWAREWLREERVAAAGEVWYYWHEAVGPSHIVGLFAWLCIVGAGVGVVHRFRQRARREYDVLKGFELVVATGDLTGALTRALYGSLSRGLAALPVSEQLARLEARSSSLFNIPALVLGMVLAGLTFLDLQDYALVGPRGVTTTHYWTGRPRHSDWSALERVEVGCWIFSEGGLALQYTPVFKDGTRINLFRQSLAAGVVAAAEKVEAIRDERDIPKRMAVFANTLDEGQEWRHPGCVDAVNKRFSGDALFSVYGLLAHDLP